MQIVFGRDIAKQISERYTVLELETFRGEKQDVEAFCVVPADKIPVEDMSRVDELKSLHQDFINSFNAEDYENCRKLYPQLHGHWKGELDSFYETIFKKVNLTNSNIR